MSADPPAPLEIAIEALDRMDKTGLRADRVVRDALRKSPHLDARGRRRAAGAVHGVCCWRARLEHLLGATEVGPRLLVAAWCVDVQGEAPDEVAGDLDLDDDGLARLVDVKEERVGWPEEPVAFLSASGSVPAWVAKRLIDERGLEDASALVKALSHPGPVSLRANPLRGSRVEIAEQLREEGIFVEPGDLAPCSLRARPGANLWGSFAWREGGFEIQDEGSQLIAEAVGAKAGETVLDLCAGRGGKTLALAAAMHDEGRLVATDVDGRSLDDLRARLTRVRLGCVEAQILPEGPEVSLALRADRVLVDAPCSALGTLRRGQDHRWRLREEEADAFPALQLELLERGASQLKAGGRLVYATCTILRAENQGVVEAFLARHGARFAPAPVFEDLDLEGGDEPQLELLPHVHGTDGFFIAAFNKRG